MKHCLPNSKRIKNQIIKPEMYRKDYLVHKGTTHQFINRQLDSFNVLYSKARVGKGKTYGFLHGLCLYKGKVYNWKNHFFGVKKETAKVIKHKNGENDIVSEGL